MHNESLVDQIVVIDDARLPKQVKEYQYFLRQEMWACNWTTEHYEYTNWGALFMGGSDATGLENCEDDLFGSRRAYLLGKFWNYIVEHHLPGHELLRFWALAFTHGMDGHVHIDGKEPDYYTTLLYIHPQWEAAWGGELLYFDQDMHDIVKVVEPKPGRIVIAPGNIPHRISPPTRDTDNLRGVVGFRSRMRQDL
jgi:hypothetical protein